jgi:3'-phosphoadenosine 5'-phosphosulfate sulfotransferase (PAPS reductase)/FAD synthetase
MTALVNVTLPGILDRGIAFTDEVRALIASGAPVAAGVSGGKDSCVLGLALWEELDKLGHTGPRVLVHSDLGSVEWKDSLPTCERLATRLGSELIVVRRAAGGMMERWRARWASSVERYASLSCVKLILPWSTPSMRFCTSELKVKVICSELRRRFAGQTILNASGIRRAESPKRKLAPVAKPQPELGRPGRRDGTRGIDWHPIIEWSHRDVYAYLVAKDFPLHEAYTTYGASRVSCAFCIMSKAADLRAAARCPDNVDIYREMVALEADSTFAFQGAAWLADVAPELLDDITRRRVRDAKHRADVRAVAEAAIPPHLLYTENWPTVMPTVDEARLIAGVRATVAETVGIAVAYTTANQVIARYAELMAAREARAS